MKSFNYIDALNDIKRMESDGLDLKSKKEIASKYGLKTAKRDDVIDAIYMQGVEYRRSTRKNDTKFDENDFLFFRYAYNVPTTTATLRKALADESDAFAIAYLTNELERLKGVKTFNRRSGWGFRQTATPAENVERMLHAYENKIKNANDDERNALIATLNEMFKTFHDEYIKRVQNWAENAYDSCTTMKKFTREDYISYFGGASLHEVAQAVNNGSNTCYRPRWWNEEVYRVALANDTYKPKYGALTLFGRVYNPSPIRVANRKKMIYSGSIWDINKRGLFNDKTLKYEAPRTVTPDELTDLMSERAHKMQSDVAFVLKWKTKQSFVDDEVSGAEKKFASDVEVVAEKIRRMNMDELSLQLISIEHDPKHFDVTMSDGEKTIHARSIWAAAESVLVTPHYRFIIT